MYVFAGVLVSVTVSVLLDDRRHFAVLDVSEERAPADRLLLGRASEPRVEQGRDAHHENEHQEPVAHEPWIQTRCLRSETGGMKPSHGEYTRGFLRAR